MQKVWGKGPATKQYYHGSLCPRITKQLYHSPSEILINTCYQNEVVDTKHRLAGLTKQLKEVQGHNRVMEDKLLRLTRELDMVKAHNSRLSQGLDIVKMYNLELTEEIAMATKEACKLKEELEGERSHIP
ncbi:hypothetical protein BHE74_00038516 [Ensete ventricosum]|uniref:Uncharacterized protein n=1 Tax=Ensete ventricosum TaxID=4639 RepID=A0A444F8R7_ENSVE|nr:hypothetical protein GW17_00016933 [Ensete ventricosum]RWW54872.1 hypothetical protein BHE74_00038516 [Ensete ventricosum]RZR74196.1 hypothetical protein BHM03_00033384 [Ensete ventricosum]